MTSQNWISHRSTWCVHLEYCYCCKFKRMLHYLILWQDKNLWSINGITQIIHVPVLVLVELYWDVNVTLYRTSVWSWHMKDPLGSIRKSWGLLQFSAFYVALASLVLQKTFGCKTNLNRSLNPWHISHNPIQI